MNTLPALKPEKTVNYAAFFLSFNCNLSCFYCVNAYNGSSLKKQEMPVEDWIRAANRLTFSEDLPLTLQGGEPTLYKDFYRFVREVKSDIKMDLLTNLMFDVESFMKNCPSARFSREAPYASIRATYHPFQNHLDVLIKKTLRLLDGGFSVGLFGILHPDPEIRNKVLSAQEICVKAGIDFRLKEFLGIYQGQLYGTFKYSEALSGTIRNSCQCRTSELLVDTAGFIYRCHSDLYGGRTPIGHILDAHFCLDQIDSFRTCDAYGLCHPCDIKIKTDRFQIYGHTSVEILKGHELLKRA
jgi:hypothetical protein